MTTLKLTFDQNIFHLIKQFVLFHIRRVHMTGIHEKDLLELKNTLQPTHNLSPDNKRQIMRTKIALHAFQVPARLVAPEDAGTAWLRRYSSRREEGWEKVRRRICCCAPLGGCLSTTLASRHFCAYPQEVLIHRLKDIRQTNNWRRSKKKNPDERKWQNSAIKPSKENDTHNQDIRKAMSTWLNSP